MKKYYNTFGKLNIFLNLTIKYMFNTSKLHNTLFDIDFSVLKRSQRS